jgi:catechol 2,3-dioxygenase-like lactoylglutathione lyase family enzyme
MINTIGVHIKVKDFKKSLKFYKDLGFKEVFGYGPGRDVAEDYSGVVFDVGGTNLEIADGHRAVKLKTFKEMVKSSKISLMIGMERLSELLEVCRKANIDVVVGPRHYYWGKLELAIRDPDGVILVFWANYDVEESKKIEADESWAIRNRFKPKREGS